MLYPKQLVFPITSIFFLISFSFNSIIFTVDIIKYIIPNTKAEAIDGIVVSINNDIILSTIVFILLILFKNPTNEIIYKGTAIMDVEMHIVPKRI